MPIIPKNITEDNLVMRDKIKELQEELPDCIQGFYMYIADKALLTQRDYLLYLKMFFEYLYGKDLREITIKDISKIDHKVVNKYLYELSYLNEKSNQPKTIAKKRTALVQFFKLAHREKWIPEDITGGFNKIKVNQNDRDIKFLDENEIMDLFDVVETGNGLTEKEYKFWEKTKYRDAAIITLFVVAALREQELRQLNISSFDWTHEVFTIYRKRNKTSKMPINNRIRNSVQNYLQLERPETDNDALFISLQGNRLSTRQIINIIKKYTSIVIGSSRSEGFSPHKLRSTSATSMVRRGIDIYRIKDYLDHENVSTTQIYAHLEENSKKDISKAMEFED